MASGGAGVDATFDPQEDRVLRPLVSQRPDVLAARAAAAMAAENVRLANAMRRPNLQLGPMWQRDDASTEFWGIQGQIDIPVVDTGKPLAAQRAAELRLQKITALQLENKAVLQARAAVQRYERARRLVDQSGSAVTGETTQVLKLFDDQFKAGQLTLLQVYAAGQPWCNLNRASLTCSTNLLRRPRMSYWQLVCHRSNL